MEYGREEFIDISGYDYPADAIYKLVVDFIFSDDESMLIDLEGVFEHPKRRAVDIAAKYNHHPLYACMRGNKVYIEKETYRLCKGS